MSFLHPIWIPRITEESNENSESQLDLIDATKNPQQSATRPG